MLDTTAASLGPRPDAACQKSILPLELKDVTFRAGGQRLLKEVSISFEAGPRSVILGPNGAGKSLLLRVMHGLLKPQEGQIIWHGAKNVPAGAAHRKPALCQAMVFQRPVMLRRTAAANIEYALSLRKIPRPERRERVEEALDLTGLARLGGRQARLLSIGQQQRLALARAWALRPQVLFLDEPTASLDPGATHHFEELVNTFHEAGTRIIMTTHDLGQARRLADEVLFINRGRLLVKEPASGFFDDPGNDYARAFLSGELLWKTAKGEARARDENKNRRNT